MTGSTIERGIPTAQTPTRRRGLTITLWVLRVLLAVFFLAAGAQKLDGTHYMVVMFDKIGAGQWLRYMVGCLEAAGAVSLLIPVLSGLSAVCLSLLMVGAAITNIVIHYNPGMPLIFLLVSVLVAIGCWPELKALPNKLIR